MAEHRAEEGSEAVDRAFGEAVGRLGPALLSGLTALEHAFRRLHPPDFPRIQAGVEPVRDVLVEVRSAFASAPTPESLADFREDLDAAAKLAEDALTRLVDPGDQGVMGALTAMREHARAQARLYPLRRALPRVSAWFAEPFAHSELETLEAKAGSDARVGLFRSGEAGARGGFDLYVPESYDGSEPWPLVVALHGGSGNGSDFLWSWLREARSRRVLLLSPTSRGSTWSLNAPEIDGRGLRELTDRVSTEWNVDRERVLLTGLSDGGTMAGLLGLGEGSPFTHLAPACGVLHPMNFASGNLDRARGLPIYLIHGALDWMFPVAMAQEAARVLEAAGADLVYREIEDLSHTYPREENARILEWLRVTPGSERTRDGEQGPS